MEFFFPMDARGQNSVLNFLATLDEKKRSKVDRYIRLVEQHGTRIGEPYVDHIEGKIWELRPGAYRLLFFVWGEKLVVTNAFRKKGNKTPNGEKNVARAAYKDWVKCYGQK